MKIRTNCVVFYFLLFCGTKRAPKLELPYYIKNESNHLMKKATISEITKIKNSERNTLCYSPPPSFHAIGDLWDDSFSDKTDELRFHGAVDTTIYFMKFVWPKKSATAAWLLRNHALLKMNCSRSCMQWTLTGGIKDRLSKDKK